MQPTAETEDEVSDSSNPVMSTPQQLSTPMAVVSPRGSQPSPLLITYPTPDAPNDDEPELPRSTSGTRISSRVRDSPFITADEASSSSIKPARPPRRVASRDNWFTAPSGPNPTPRQPIETVTRGTPDSFVQRTRESFPWSASNNPATNHPVSGTPASKTESPVAASAEPPVSAAAPASRTAVLAPAPAPTLSPALDLFPALTSRVNAAQVRDELLELVNVEKERVRQLSQTLDDQQRRLDEQDVLLKSQTEPLEQVQELRQRVERVQQQTEDMVPQSVMQRELEDLREQLAQLHQGLEQQTETLASQPKVQSEVEELRQRVERVQQQAKATCMASQSEVHLELEDLRAQLAQLRQSLEQQASAQAADNEPAPESASQSEVEELRQRAAQSEQTLRELADKLASLPTTQPDPAGFCQCADQAQAAPALEPNVDDLLQRIARLEKENADKAGPVPPTSSTNDNSPNNSKPPNNESPHDESATSESKPRKRGRFNIKLLLALLGILISLLTMALLIGYAIASSSALHYGVDGYISGGYNGHENVVMFSSWASFIMALFSCAFFGFALSTLLGSEVTL